MDGGPSEEVIFTVADPDFGDIEEFDRKYDKEFQLYQLLIRNKSYMADMKSLRKKYSVGQYPVESDRSGIDKLLDPEDEDVRKKFYEEVKAIAAKIQFPGDWQRAVRKHVVGYAPEVCFVVSSASQKKITARVHSNHVELHLYGDLTVPELRTAATEIRKLVTGLQGRLKTDGGTKYKTRLDKNLRVLDMANNGIPYLKIAKFCNEQGIQRGMQYADVSKYVEQAQQQIAKIYA